MKTLLIRDTNPFTASSADANRTLGLINGLTRLGVEVVIVDDTIEKNFGNR